MDLGFGAILLKAQKKAVLTMKMEQRTFRIGDLAQHLGVERFVIRFWEKEFDLYPSRSEGGQRYYTDTDAKKFALIKELLYQKGFTIAGAKKYLVQAFGAFKKHKIKKIPRQEKTEFVDKLVQLRQALLLLRQKLS
jgi:DNA-binding transcriptional MerR regulator